MPWDDWQFLTVTSAALWGAVVLVRQVVPARRGADDAPCAGCASGAAACSRRIASANDDERPSPLVVLRD